MGRAGIGLFSGLATFGAVAGWIIGELALGSGRGPVTALATAAVGLLVAWALRATRPTAAPPEEPLPAKEQPMPLAKRGGKPRPQSTRAKNVRVQKSRSIERSGRKGQ